MDLDELLAQRAIIARHLDWLDQRIAQVRNGAADTAGTETEVDQAIAGPTADETQDLRVSGPSIRRDGLSGTERLGCTVVLATAAVLFLAALFILPFFIYGE